MKQIPALVITAILLFALPLCTHGGEIVISAVGDIMLAGKWAPILKKKGYDAPLWRGGGGTGRQRHQPGKPGTPIASGGRGIDLQKIPLPGRAGGGRAVRKAGFDLVNLANNDSMDFGSGALAETMANTGGGRHRLYRRRRGPGRGAQEGALLSSKSEKIALPGYP